MKSNKIPTAILGLAFVLMSFTALHAQQPPAPNVEEAEIYKVVEQMPRFPGCEMMKAAESVIKKCANEKLRAYLRENLVYPQEALEQKVEGTSVVTFVIETDGSISTVELVRDPGAGTGAEAVRLVNSMNSLKQRWSPGRQRGVAKRVLFTLPISFKLKRYLEMQEKKETGKEMGSVHGKKLGKVSPFGKAGKAGKVVNGNQTSSEMPPPPPAPSNEEIEIFKVVEQMPRFPGCENLRASEEVVKNCAKEKMFEFIAKNLIYQKAAKEAKVEGTAVVNFVVSKKGQLENIKILRDVDGHFGDVVTQLIQSMPTWIPGKQRGKAVAVLYTLPVKFALDKDLNVKGTSKEGDTGAMDKNGKGDKMGKSSKVVKVSPFGQMKKEDTPNADTPPPPPPPHKEEVMETFKVVEQMPRFPGCEKMNGTQEEIGKCAQEKMLQYLYKTLRYPSLARENSVEGMAVIQFIVEKDGSINNAEIVRDPGSGLGAEALRVINTMNDMPNKWTPGSQKGVPVSVQYNMPVRFKLEGDKVKSTKKWWQIWK